MGVKAEYDEDAKIIQTFNIYTHSFDKFGFLANLKRPLFRQGMQTLNILEKITKNIVVLLVLFRFRIFESRKRILKHETKRRNY